MSNSKDKPKGYFDYLLAIDCETTGLCFNSDIPCHDPRTNERHQTVSWGLIVADGKHFKPIEELYLEIKWNEESKAAKIKDSSFGKKAEEIHGLSFDYLEENGVTEEEAVVQIGNLIMKYWGPTTAIKTLGHNVINFDMPFLRDLFRRHGIELRFGNRHYDSNSLSIGTVGAFNSDDLFSTMGFETRDKHNSLDDARMSLETFRQIKILWDSKVGIRAYE